MEHLAWIDAPRTTVEMKKHPLTGERHLIGTETADRNRANIFGDWRDDEPDDEDDESDELDGSGRYYPASANTSIGVEVEVRFAWYDGADIEDHAEVYLWQIYYWKLGEDGPVCKKDETFGGDFVVEAGGLAGPEAMFGPMVSQAVRRIHDARWNKIDFEPRQVGHGSA